jgi:hypothetical protein
VRKAGVFRVDGDDDFADCAFNVLEDVCVLPNAIDVTSITCIYVFMYTCQGDSV